MDWITLTIEAIGVVIILIWTYLPIREFKLIHERLTRKNQEPPK